MHDRLDNPGHGSGTDRSRARTALFVVGALLVLVVGGALHLAGVLPPGS
jgi:hypothetical protein